MMDDANDADDDDGDAGATGYHRQRWASASLWDHPCVAPRIDAARFFQARTSRRLQTTP